MSEVIKSISITFDRNVLALRFKRFFPTNFCLSERATINFPAKEIRADAQAHFRNFSAFTARFLKSAWPFWVVID